MNLPDFLRRWLPSRTTLANNKALRWLGPKLHDSRLWYINRHAVARGTAIGLFFGFIIPVGQMPAAVATALMLRGNLWIAAASTFISNPLTYAPIYYLAYRVGNFLLSQHDSSPTLAAALPPSQSDHSSTLQWLTDSIHWLTSVGQPLLLGLATFAISAALLGYYGVLSLWRLHVMLRRYKKRQKGRIF